MRMCALQHMSDMTQSGYCSASGWGEQRPPTGACSRVGLGGGGLQCRPAFCQQWNPAPAGVNVLRTWVLYNGNVHGIVLYCITWVLYMGIWGRCCGRAGGLHWSGGHGLAGVMGRPAAYASTRALGSASSTCCTVPGLLRCTARSCAERHVRGKACGARWPTSCSLVAWRFAGAMAAASGSNHCH